MNDKQEKQKSTDNSAEPLTKKVAKFSALIYLGLAITVVIVATVGIFNMSYDYDLSLDPISIPDMDISDISMPDFSLPDIDNSTDSPVNNEQSGVTDEIQSNDSSIEPPVIKYYYPVKGEILKNYSMEALVFSETMGDYRVHTGIDIAAAEGTPVVCFADGVVESVTDDFFYGTTVAVAHTDGSVSYYMNLAPELAANIIAGNKVLAGQQLGSVGNTARCENADPSHLHFEIRVDGVLTDPKNELPS